MKFSLLHVLPLCLLAAAVYISEPASDEKCSTLEIIIARGTDEPLNPSFGIIVGDPLFQALQKLVPAVIGYAVDYPASSACDSEQIGVNDTLAHLAQKSAQCPDMKYALVGYSQGADVMHNAAQGILPSLFPAIIALVMFGDPGNKGANSPDVSGGTVPAFPSALAEKLKENCAEGDPVCSDGADLNAHLSYDNPNTTYIPDSATYIATQFSSDGVVGPEPSINGAESDNSTADASANASALSALASLLGTSGISACPSSATSTAVAGTSSAASIKPSVSVVPGSSPAPVSASSATVSKSTSAASIASSVGSSKTLSSGVTLPTSNAPSTTSANSLASLTVTTPVITFTGGAAPRMKILW